MPTLAPYPLNLWLRHPGLRLAVGGLELTGPAARDSSRDKHTAVSRGSPMYLEPAAGPGCGDDIKLCVYTSDSGESGMPTAT